MDYVNVPRTIAAVLSSRLATLHELETVYSAEDLYTLVEVRSVDAINQRIAMQQD